MGQPSIRRYQECVTVVEPAEALYDMVSDITGTGEWSPVCTSCWWDEGAQAGQVGAWFTWHNRLPPNLGDPVGGGGGRAWTRARLGRGRQLRPLGLHPRPRGPGNNAHRAWESLPAGLAMFEEKFGDQANAQIADRTQQALVGIPKTLAAIKRIVESTTGAGAQARS